MGKISITRVVDVPLDTVFDYVDDYHNTTKYMQGLSRWIPTGDIMHGKGAEFDVAMKAGPWDLGSVVEITRWTANKLIGWESRSGFHQDGQWAFKKQGAGTELTFTLEYEFPGGLAGKALSRGAEPIVRMNLEKSLDTLVAKLQSVRRRS